MMNECELGSLKNHDKYIVTLSDYFLYSNVDSSVDSNVDSNVKLKTQWMSLKFRIKDMLEDTTPTKRFINKVLNNRVAFKTIQKF